MKTKNQIVVSHIEVQNLKASDKDRMFTEIMVLLHNEGAIIDRQSQNGLTAYWIGTKGTGIALRSSVRALQKAATRLSGFGYKLLSAITVCDLPSDGYSPLSAAGRTLISHRAKLAAEISALNGFVGGHLLMDASTAKEMGSWHPTELAGRGRLSTSQESLVLYRLAAEKKAPVVIPARRAQHITVAGTSPVSGSLPAEALSNGSEDLESVIERLN